MSEYTNVEIPFLEKLSLSDLQVVEHGPEIPLNPGTSQRTGFRESI